MLSFLSIRSDNTYSHKEFYLSFLCGVGLSIFLIPYYSFFPDFENYSNYIVNGNALARFGLEPLSGWLMYATGLAGCATASEYYLITTLVLLMSLLYVCYTVDIKFRLATFLTLTINPITLILIQTPRHAMAMGLLMLALVQTKKLLSFLLLFMAISTHTIMGVFGVLFYLSTQFQNKINVVVFLFCIFIFSAVTAGIIPTHYEMYGVSGIQRGVGRVSVMLMYTALFVFMLRGFSQEKLYIIIITCFIYILFLISPFAHRLTAVAFYMSVLFYFHSRLSITSRVVRFVICLGTVISGLGMIWFGSFGYSV